MVGMPQPNLNHDPQLRDSVVKSITASDDPYSAAMAVIATAIEVGLDKNGLMSDVEYQTLTAIALTAVGQDIAVRIDIDGS